MAKLNEYAQLRALHREVIGFIDGTFDVLHMGHGCLIDYARKNCQFLVAFVKSDEQLRYEKVDYNNGFSTRSNLLYRVKGISETYRRNSLLSLMEAIKHLKPDYFVTAHPARYPKEFYLQLTKQGCIFQKLAIVPGIKPFKKL